MTLPEPGAELELLHLPGGGAGQRFLELEGGRALVVGEVGSAMFDEIRPTRHRPGVENYERPDRLAPLRIGHSDDGGLGDR